ncbi:MAG: lactate utilization protein [Chloroflexota bacterium]|nr:MAG: lactate utilization protein [Chloroflexota bacterium]
MEDSGLPIWIVEPGGRERQRSAARMLSQVGQGNASAAETIDIAEARQRLMGVRQHTRENLDVLVEQLRAALERNYPAVKVKEAGDGAEAISYIARAAEGMKVVSTNNSSTVAQELKPGLLTKGFSVVNSYVCEFESGESHIEDYWDLPRLQGWGLTANIEVARRLSGLDDPAPDEHQTRDYLAVLGVNAVSATDGTVFFLQHFSNIYRDLRQAKKVFLVVGLDKIVRDRDDAAFQTRCMGLFGLENLLLGMQPRAGKPQDAGELAPLSPDVVRELHLIILDNRRRKLLDGKFRDLLLCIDCRACNLHCPIRFSFDVDYAWTPKTYLHRFLNRKSNSMDTCLHCEACRLECPLEIDLPSMMWQAKMYHQGRRSLKYRLLGKPEALAIMGTRFAPVSNWMTRFTLFRILMELLAGIDRRVTLPVFQKQPFRKRV